MSDETTPLAAADFTRGDEIVYAFTVPGLPEVGTLMNRGVVTGVQKGCVFVRWYGGNGAMFGPNHMEHATAPVSALTRTGMERLRWLESVVGR